MGSKSSLCEQQGWCFYEATDWRTNIVEMIYLVSLIIISVFIFKYLTRVKKYREDERYKQLFADSFLHVYHLIIAWFSCSVAKAGINVIIFFQYMNDSTQSVPQLNDLNIIYAQEPQISSGIVIFSVVFLLLDFFCTYLVLNLILIIPCHWLNIVLLSVNQSKNIELQTRKKLSKCFFILKLLNGYIKFVRPAFIVFLLTQPFILFLEPKDSKIGCSLPKINTFIVTTETIFIFFFYIFAYLVAEYTRKKKLIKMKVQEYKRLRTQYLLLMSVLVIRVILNFIFRLSPRGTSQLNETCVENNRNYAIRMTIFLSLGHTCMHLVPIIIILYIYRPIIEVRQRDQTLLIHFDSQDANSASDRETRSNPTSNSQNYINKTMQIERERESKTASHA